MNELEDPSTKKISAALALIQENLNVILIFGITNGMCDCGKANCKNPGKHPIKKWGTEASFDPKQIEESVAQYPNCNLAIVTGSGLGVLDVDRKSGGFESLAELEKQYGVLPVTPTANTGGGGKHYYFDCLDLDLRNTAGTLPGLDFRGNGGMIIVPPSGHQSGGSYLWEDGKSIFKIERAPIPMWLVEQVIKPAKAKSRSVQSKLVEKVAEGSRNDSLFRLACSLRARGNSDNFILTALVTANMDLCVPPLDDDELLTVANNAAKYQPPSNSDSYFVQDGRTFRKYFDRKGEPQTQELCNFESRIAGEEIFDDGLEQNRIFTIVSKTANGKSISTIRISASEFSPLSWVLPQLGGGAIIYPTPAAVEHFRTAIQSLSLDHPVIIKYIHLGWRYISGKYFFLHAAGAISEDGLSSEISVSADEGRLNDFALPEPPSGKRLIESIRASLEFLDVVKDTPAGFCLYSALWRAPLNEARPLDFSVWIAGETGTLKSEICGVIQAHFGSAFRGKNLPECWNSTVASMEYRAFLAKDVVFVIDDYVPAEVSPAVVGRVLRSQGNKSGRGRMWSDGTMRPMYFPRCLPIATAEDVVGTGSLKARLAICDIVKGDICKSQLQKLQDYAASGTLAEAMSGYLKWLAPQIDTLKGSLAVRFRELRELATDSDMHLRTPELTGSLALGLEQFLKFAIDVGAIQEAEREAIWKRGWDQLQKMAKNQFEYQSAEDPANRFIDLIRAAFAGHRAHLTNTKYQVPSEANSWGWKEDNDVFYPKGTRVGFVKDDEICLEPENAFAVAQMMARDQGKPFFTSKETVWKRLAERKLIKTSPSEGKNTVKVQISANSRPRLLIFPDKEVLRPASAFHSAPQAPEAPHNDDSSLGGYSHEDLLELKERNKVVTLQKHQDLGIKNGKGVH